MMAAVAAHGRIARLPDLVNGDDAVVRRGRFLTTVFLLGIDDVEYLVTVVEGRIARFERGPFLMRHGALPCAPPPTPGNASGRPRPATTISSP
jgi:hypothetical protein